MESTQQVDALVNALGLDKIIAATERSARLQFATKIVSHMNDLAAMLPVSELPVLIELAHFVQREAEEQ